ncbi:MAG: energy-coupling factor ABC transporter permease [Myxococcota bacterium]|nr:energy-coupling factor ABC transporter permease [Myxococcota bacterium]
MHMADALVSPAVGGVLWAGTAGLVGWSARAVQRHPDHGNIPLMGVAGAFVFTAQMINFAIPGTGSSGHLGGALLLSILLGPHAAFLVMASVLTVQALFFADGGLLALGANIFNLSFFPCYLAYPLVFKPIAGTDRRPVRIYIAAIVAAVLGAQVGSLFVVLETTLSGIAALPFLPFALAMQPIHLAIGLVEGLATAAIVLFICRLRPSMVDFSNTEASHVPVSSKAVVALLGVSALVVGGGLSWFAADAPDGLEWSIETVAKSDAVSLPSSPLRENLGSIQEKTAILPDYDFKAAPIEREHSEDVGGPVVANAGTSLAGLAGGCLTLILIIGLFIGLKRWQVSKQG